MKFDVIQTQRLDLRKLTPEQYGDILLNCSNQEIMEYLNLEEPEVNIEKEKLKRGFSTHNKSFEIFQLIDKEMYKIIDWRGFHTWFNHRRAKIE